MDDRLQRQRTSRRERLARRVVRDRAIELPPKPWILQRRIRPVAGDHLVEHHAERPEVRVHVHALRSQALRRRVRDRAADVGRELARFLEHLRHAEVEHLALAARGNLDVRRLEIVVQQPVRALLHGD